MNAHVNTVSQIIPSFGAYRALIQRRPFDHAFLVELSDGVILLALGILQRYGQ